MAYADLSPDEKAMLHDFLRNYRAAVADTVRGLRNQQLLAMAYTSHIADIWAKVGNSDVIQDGSGLAGADTQMTKADWTPKFVWTSNLLSSVYADNGGVSAVSWPDRETVDAMGVQLAGPTNV